ncbi:MAG: 30S ribosomal protein S5 [Candidatus Ryanbacteria bacterium RIFCSPHIGHO2_02_FULL_45_43]|uniref:Small ribosomal subunit protein uS5 n=1 Tax=Candidatus Ryanbacteria bacterium RIFCSPHIGHO2_01_45_13 TaxID=1802112 RepID=A0A1G2FXB0_9BACT|nr:MAG: 30S ribosomal protein S5 [Candidatus Ryanbacteria bacterium RIFCSPHIGHO2_01_FULL_44_130]OGZ42457.1 MAG: 30S ribosomal protein S5 [Candidatus Ryanbacteria bacterium RIFCSPHIGHO2_01_45_13]OGZ48474.1 MAG: 30S ribosomal protein S5 [Candidatus Ryanbacteria bacterium RIFCSPHIGHO2_02_FULL_45_43]OGZ50339.1 MAG: 30S ribosomal protein S5 [Candidatus Ryanbacteria bacterium RIFCSPHIGHO2_12_FULL_44_20]OGZ51678.1 MAG: 30S ribosomal protein S5 [Candidatus Ryanbacteria bacterium RIFCSPLOWO2_01_FULL_44_
MRRTRAKKETSDVEYKVVDMRRVARVVSGGRRFSFRATVVAGDRKGKVGVGIGKGKDTSLAIDKALRLARKSFISVPLTSNKSIPHDVSAKYGSSALILKPGRFGRGLVAGSAVRVVLELAGVEDATAKITSRSTNRLNNARAVLEALKRLQPLKNHPSK